MNECLRYEHPDGRSYEELMSGKRRRLLTTSLTHGTPVTLTGYDEESAWPVIEWTDASGSARRTTIDPVMFAEYFVPVMEQE
jgi:hypothetical protein